jgi:competence protein ComEC
LGVARLDRVVISHGDSDHAGGFAAVRAAIPVVDWRAPQGMLPEADAPCVADQQWQWDGVEFRFLHPTPAFPYLRNDSSCVLRVQGRHGALLLTGDIGEVIEQGMLKRRPQDLRAEVVLAPHHGSAGSSQAAFVAATGARLLLVSSGHGNRFGHPRAEVVQRWREAGAEVLNTADSGAVRVWLGAEGLQLRERRRVRPRIWDAAERARSAAILSSIKQAADVPEG